MRTLIVVAVVVLLFALIGWVSFSTGPDRSSINLETDAIKKDTQQALESGSELLRDAEEAIERSPNQDERSREPAEQPEPSPTPGTESPQPPAGP